MSTEEDPDQPVTNIQTWPSCGTCDREFNPTFDQIFDDFVIKYPSDDTFILGWRCPCGSVSYTALLDMGNETP